MLAECWPNVGRMLAVCWLYVGRMLAVCWPNVGCMLAECWLYVGCMLAVCLPCSGRMLAVCWPYIGHTQSPIIPILFANCYCYVDCENILLCLIIHRLDVTKFAKMFCRETNRKFTVKYEIVMLCNNNICIRNSMLQ